MHGSHGQELGIIYSKASKNAPILTISQQILTASHFGQQQWIRKALISRIDVSCIMFSHAWISCSSVGDYLFIKNKRKKSPFFDVSQQRLTASHFRQQQSIRGSLAVPLPANLWLLVKEAVVAIVVHFFSKLLFLSKTCFF